MTKKKKSIILSIIFLISLFYFSNATNIYGGTCTSSPCSGLNGSFTDDGYSDYFIGSNSIPYIAPSTFFLKDILTNAYDEIEFSRFANTPWNLEFDNIEDWQGRDAETLYHESNQQDFKIFPGAYFLIKFIVLLNLIIWVPILLLLLKLQKKHPHVAFVFLILPAIPALLKLNLAIFILPAFEGENIVTLSFLLRAIGF